MHHLIYIILLLLSLSRANSYLKWATGCYSSDIHLKCSRDHRIVIHDAVLGIVVNSSLSAESFLLDIPPPELTIHQGLSCLTSSEKSLDHNCGRNVLRSISRLCSGEEESCKISVRYRRDIPVGSVKHCAFSQYQNPVLYVQYRCVLSDYFQDIFTSSLPDVLVSNGYITSPSYLKGPKWRETYVDFKPAFTRSKTINYDGSIIQFRVIDLDLYGSEADSENCQPGGNDDEIEIWGAHAESIKEERLIFLCGDHLYNESVFHARGPYINYGPVRLSANMRVDLPANRQPYQGILMEFVVVQCQPIRILTQERVMYRFDPPESDKAQGKVKALINCGLGRFIFQQVQYNLSQSILKEKRKESLLKRLLNQSIELECDAKTLQWLPQHSVTLQCLTLLEIEELIRPSTTAPPNVTAGPFPNSSSIASTQPVSLNISNKDDHDNTSITTIQLDKIPLVEMENRWLVFFICFVVVVVVTIVVSCLCCLIYRHNCLSCTRTSTNKTSINLYRNFHNNVSDVSSHAATSTPLLYKPMSVFTLSTRPSSAYQSSLNTPSSATLRTPVSTQSVWDESKFSDLFLPQKAPRQPNRLSQFFNFGARPVSGSLSGSGSFTRRAGLESGLSATSIGGSALRVNGANHLSDAVMAPNNRQLSLDLRQTRLDRENPYLEPSKSTTVLRRAKISDASTNCQYSCYDITQSPRHSLDFDVINEAEWNQQGNRQSVGGMLSNHYYEHRDSIYESLDKEENSSMEPLPRSRYPLPPCPVDEEDEAGYQTLDPPRDTSLPDVHSP